MAKLPMKPYRLKSGTHRMPNPEFKAPLDPNAESYGEDSHIVVKAGEICDLTDEQFKAFKHKFAPLGTGATDVRDADVEEFEAAKLQAALTGQNVDPNKFDKADPFATARAGAVPTSQ